MSELQRQLQLAKVYRKLKFLVVDDFENFRLSVRQIGHLVSKISKRRVMVKMLLHAVKMSHSISFYVIIIWEMEKRGSKFLKSSGIIKYLSIRVFLY